MTEEQLEEHERLHAHMMERVKAEKAEALCDMVINAKIKGDEA